MTAVLQFDSAFRGVALSGLVVPPVSRLAIASLNGSEQKPDDAEDQHQNENLARTQ